MSRLLLLGDLAPVGISRTLIERGDLMRSDLLLANLETPLDCDHLSPLPKAGTHLRGDAAALVPFHELARNAVLTLANNHIGDYGERGLTRTLAAARKLGFTTVGAGANRVEAMAPRRLILAGGIRVTIVAAAERQYGQADHARAGVAAFDELALQVPALRKECDVLVASVHGGAEGTCWPSPTWQRQLHLLTELGVSIVHAHHPHLRQGFEERNGSWIVYGLGHSLVNPSLWSDQPDALSSFSFEFDVAALDQAPTVRKWELEQTDPATVVSKLATMNSTQTALLNDPLKDPVLLEALWQHHAVDLWESFYAGQFGLASSRGRRLRRVLADLRYAIPRPPENPAKSNRAQWWFHVASSPYNTAIVTTALGLKIGEVSDLRTLASEEIYRQGMRGCFPNE